MLILAILLAGPAHCLVPATLYPECLSNPRVMTGDPDNCHIFYQCEINPSPMSCGDMMFNTEKQVCDWPYNVIQTRPECRNIEKISVRNELGYPFQRTMRMLSFFDETDPKKQSNGNEVQAELQRKIFLEIQRRLPGLLNRKIQKYVSTLNQIPVHEKNHQPTYDYDYDYQTISEPISTTTTQRPTTTSMTTSTTSTTTQPPSTTRVIYTFRSDAIPSVPQIQRPQKTPYSDRQRSLRPQPTPYNQIQSLRPQPIPYNQIQRVPQPSPYNELHRSLSPSYTYQHQFVQKVRPQQKTDVSEVSRLATKTNNNVDVEYNTHIEEVEDDYRVEDKSLESLDETTTATGVVEEYTTSKPAAPTHIFTTDPNDNRRWTVSRKRPSLRNCTQNGNCPKPRRVILRKKRRKLYTNEKERLQERRNSLLNKEYDAVVVANGYEGTYNENKKEDTIERNVEKKDQAYEEAIEKLKSLIREKQTSPDNVNSDRRSGKIVSVSYSTSSN